MSVSKRDIIIRLHQRGINPGHEVFSQEVRYLVFELLDKNPENVSPALSKDIEDFVKYFQNKTKKCDLVIISWLSEEKLSNRPKRPKLSLEVANLLKEDVFFRMLTDTDTEVMEDEVTENFIESSESDSDSSESNSESSESENDTL
jgi:predicted phosphoadenosine phosphosulfate sulfurtransferase